MKEFDRNRFLVKANRLLELIDEEVHSFGDTQSERVDTFDLDVASKHLREMRANVKNETLPPREKRFPVLARLVVDQWPLGNKLGTQIIEAEKLYQQL